MKQNVAVSLVIAACAFARPVPAQQVEKPVPIVKAPYHRPVFTNQYVTLLDVYIPPGRQAGYHIHSLDQVSVVVGDADQAGQTAAGLIGPHGELDFVTTYPALPADVKEVNISFMLIH